MARENKIRLEWVPGHMSVVVNEEYGQQAEACAITGMGMVATSP